MKPQSIQESRWIGRILRGKWQIERKIARGGMGTVFAATHKNNGSTVAIKILHPELSRDVDTRSRFMQEAYAANQVNHPGVVRILDDDITEDGVAYLVMELLEGERLEQRRLRKGGKLPLVEVYEFADQLLDVLASAHANGIIHRDVKPDNLFLTNLGRLKVLDFGFARVKSGYRTEQTATGFLLGTPGFMAPEQATGNRNLIDAQTDIWAVGATMFLLLTGEPCHAGEGAAEMLVAAANFPVRSITTLAPHLPAKLSFAIDRALAFDKSERWPDARSMQDALRGVPGRLAPAEPIRRSIPDDERFVVDSQPLDSRQEDATVMEHIEELGMEELISEPSISLAAPEPHAADGEGPTRAYVRGDADVFQDETKPRAPPYAHPADDEKPTVADGARPMLVGQAEPASEAVIETTVVMPSRPLHPVGSGRESYGQPSQAEMMFIAGPARPREQPPRRPRVLVFVLVAGISIVVVIVTALLVMLGLN